MFTDNKRLSCISNADMEIVKKVSREFPPKTKFVSLFGAKDVVSDKDKFFIDKFGEVYIHGISGNHRLIFNGKYWAEIINEP